MKNLKEIPDELFALLENAGLGDRQSVLKQTSACFLCSGKTAVFGLWKVPPQQAKLVGQPEGKQRVICFGLCDACSEDPLVQERVEQKHIGNLQAQGE